ncbi:MAG: hypothetical protein ACT4NL_17740 [Pseudomarimonas sp.]
MKNLIRWYCAFLLLTLGCSPLLAATALTYKVEYIVGFDVPKNEATVSIRLEPGTGRAQRLRLFVDAKRHHSFSGDGKIEQDGKIVTWRPGKEKAELKYRYRVDKMRRGGEFDARMTSSWALLRIDRLIPAAAVLAPGGAKSTGLLRFVLPTGWNDADVAYRRDKRSGAFPINNPGRRFQRPLGWMIAGDVGNRREIIDETRVAVVAPLGEAMRRNDVLAIINVTMPEMRHAFGRLPTKLLIVGAGDPMWRGGRSGPGSMFLHPDRPLISENGSSTLVHEMVHVISDVQAADGDDWIAEGMAEFYSIEILRRSGLLSEARAVRAFAWKKRHGRAIKTLRTNNSFGERTARAVSVFHELDNEIRRRSDDRYSIDNVFRPLVGRSDVSTADLKAATAKLLGGPSKVLQDAVIGE